MVVFFFLFFFWVGVTAIAPVKTSGKTSLQVYLSHFPFSWLVIGMCAHGLRLDVIRTWGSVDWSHVCEDVSSANYWRAHEHHLFRLLCVSPECGWVSSQHRDLEARVPARLLCLKVSGAVSRPSRSGSGNTTAWCTRNVLSESPWELYLWASLSAVKHNKVTARKVKILGVSYNLSH